MNGVEGAGEAVSGAMLARAVEPAAGEASPASATACLNCGTLLIGNHCHSCGQAAHVHRSLSAWWHDFLHGVLHLDGKFWRTLPMLAWHPGELTRRYVEGERARFISPLALFLFSVFLMFAVATMTGTGPLGAGEAMERDLTEEVAQRERRIVTLEAERERAAGGELGRIDAKIDELRAEQEAIRKFGDASVVDTDVRTGWERLDKGIEKANRNPSLLLYKLQANAYKFSWALIPISVPFVWLLFLHRRRYRQGFHVYDHVVFVTYSIAFMSLALIALLLLKAIGADIPAIQTAFLLIPPIHIYRQLRGAYGLSRPSALWRTAALLFFAAQALTLFVLLLLALGVLA